MPTLLDFRRRIRSVKNTQQITRAMKFVAAARLRRAQEAALAARPYAKELARVLRSIMSRIEQPEHPLLAHRPEEKILVIVLTGERGLAGAFNSNILRKANELFRPNKGKKLSVIPVGKKGRDALKKAGFHIAASRAILAQVADATCFPARDKHSQLVVGCGPWTSLEERFANGDLPAKLTHHVQLARRSRFHRLDRRERVGVGYFDRIQRQLLGMESSIEMSAKAPSVQSSAWHTRSCRPNPSPLSLPSPQGEGVALAPPGTQFASVSSVRSGRGRFENRSRPFGTIRSRRETLSLRERAGEGPSLLAWVFLMRRPRTSAKRWKNREIIKGRVYWFNWLIRLIRRSVTVPEVISGFL